MRVRVLGAYGGEAGALRKSAYLLDDRVLLDAGDACAGLTLEQMRDLAAVVVTHVHLDHVASIPFILDNRIGLANGKTSPSLPIHALRETISALRVHLFNDKLWPDFERIPDPRAPLLRYVEVERERPFQVEHLTFTPYAVNHTVPTVGYRVSDGSATVVFSSDTGPTHRIWEQLSLATDLRAIFLDVSFPARLDRIALQSKHLSTETLRGELSKIKPRVPIYLIHMKPPFLDEIGRELAAVRAERPEVELVEQGREYLF
jgi:3',5'-cyclic-nucleotide phosphodiesterase